MNSMIKIQEFHFTMPNRFMRKYLMKSSIRPLIKSSLAVFLATAFWCVWFALQAYAQGPVGETGSVNLPNIFPTEVTVNLTHTYIDPVVVAFINTRNGDESIDVRVRNVTTNSFQIFMLEPDLGGLVAETASYIVME